MSTEAESQQVDAADPAATEVAAKDDIEATTDDVALRLDGLTKRFGRTTAVKDITYTVERGSFSGIVGPNGAGKTTTLSMISGLLPPSSGSVEVLGDDVWRDRQGAQKRIGTLPDRLRMFEQLTGAQYLSYVGSIRGLSKSEVLERTENLVDAFDLRDNVNRLVVDYSSGLRKKLGLAATLIHNPELLVLDEPLDAIDPVSAGTIVEVLETFTSRGGTVLLSSHSMDFVQRVCDHIAVIVDGELIAEGDLDEVRGELTLEERFRRIVRGPEESEGLDWLDISFR
ncbi:ABC transporter ATP-binding protein [Gulosibacter molinativorax]|uniref:ABC transporter ATP-binding protein n=1 Tax=Gulosibacter molinativorax TaxID=256821 RepID=A0ABT7C607_9MICO|nr:ABC transporter ATP-binding protein [Gulosibacter molinativorax]MDJ1370625.1 ABC transporter ATP-binding protein [Gulosibacter molinativorax]QUY61961.1 ABC transporter, ATP-binding protein [Gulosibacter molinativorax]